MRSKFDSPALERREKSGVFIKSGMPTILQTVAQWLSNFAFSHIPIKLSTQQVEDLSVMRSRESIQESVKASVSQFCQTWIPRLYGVPPESPYFRDACLCELTRWHAAFGVPMNYSFAKTHWYWSAKGKVPERLGAIVAAANLFYTILYKFGIQITYSIQVF